MSGLLIGLIIVVSILLALVVLVQNSKGGGLASGFQSSGQMFGVRRATDFLEKATWGLASALIVLSVLASVLGTSGSMENTKESLAKKNAGDAPAAPAAPTTPQQQPAAPAGK